jgi:signal transduction histidine kinase
VALANDVVKTLAPQAAKKSVTLDVDLVLDLPRIAADPTRLRQVLFNLTENAIKFSPRGGRVTIAVRPTEVDRDAEDEMGVVLMAAPQRALEFAVIDRGPGIPRGEQAKIFDAFYQIDGSSTREHGGTGLGLSIVKRLVEAHGGTIWVESVIGEGSAFRFTLLEPDE